jgi:hypothetical protein
VCVFLLLAIFGTMYILNIVYTVFTHSTGLSCRSKTIHIAYERITIWNWIVIAIIGFALYKIKEHL